MSTDQNKAVVRRFYEAFEANDEAAMKATLAPDLVAYTHGSPAPQTREAMLQGISLWNAAFDTHFTVDEQIAEGDSVAVSVTMRAAHTRGDFQGVPPSGKEAETHSLAIERLKDGKIVERQVFSDWMGLMQQLGIIPPSQAAR